MNKDYEYRVALEINYGQEYVDAETGESLYNNTSETEGGYWVILWNKIENCIDEWLECFGSPEKAKEHIKQLEAKEGAKNA